MATEGFLIYMQAQTLIQARLLFEQHVVGSSIRFLINLYHYQQ